MDYDDDTIYSALSIYLLSQNNLGNINAIKILEEVKSIQSLYEVLKNNDLNYKNINIKKIDRTTLGPIVDKLAKLDINVLSYWHKGYPEMLKQIHNPPFNLYYKGNLNFSSKLISVVGTRSNTSYGERVTRELVSYLVKSGFGIVSGLATGIDAIAHDEAIKNNGYTIAVQASGVNNPQPLNNIKLYNSILNSNGLIISEYIDQINTNPGMFAHRNRIIAGLSVATIVVEAGEKSGALITANNAFDSNREVFAIPGSIYAKQSSGCNNLISQQKAHIVNNFNDILFELGLKNTSKISNFDLSSLTLGEQKVFQILNLEPKSIDELSLELEMEARELFSICSLMEIKNIIKKSFEGKYNII